MAKAKSKTALKKSAKTSSKKKTNKSATKKTSVKPLQKKRAAVKSAGKAAIKKAVVKKSLKKKASGSAVKKAASPKTLTKKADNRKAVKKKSVVKKSAKKVVVHKAAKKAVAKKALKKTVAKKALKKAVAKKALKKAIVKKAVKKAVVQKALKRAILKKALANEILRHPEGSKRTIEQPAKIVHKKMPRNKKVKYTVAELKHFRGIILDEQRAILESARANMAALVDNESGEYKGDNLTYASHMAEQGTDEMEREKNYMFVQRDEKYLGYLQDALMRIDQGTYGICVDCKDEPKNLCRTCPLIPKERLEVVPITTHCIECKNLRSS